MYIFLIFITRLLAVKNEFSHFLHTLDVNPLNSYS